MEQKINYKKDRIVKITTYVERDSHNYYWKDLRITASLFGLVKKPAGIYKVNFMESDSYYGENPPRNHMIKNGKVFYKPHMEVSSLDGSCIIYYETKQELMDAAEDLKNETGAEWQEFDV